MNSLDVSANYLWDQSQSHLLKVTGNSMTTAEKELESDKHESKTTTKHCFLILLTAFRNPEETTSTITSLVLWMRRHKQGTNRQEKLWLCKVLVTVQTLLFKLWWSGRCLTEYQLSYLMFAVGWKTSHRLPQNSFCGVNLPCGNLFMQSVTPSANFQGLAENMVHGWKVATF